MPSYVRAGIRKCARIRALSVFIRRKAEEQEKSYYFVGSAVALDDVRESVNRSENGSESKVVVSTIKLIKPVDPELYRHLTGKSAL